MSSIVKTFLALTGCASLITGGIIVKKHPEALGLPQPTHHTSISPVIIFQDGTIRFLGRIPPASIATKIRAAAKNQDTELLNSQLVKYRFYPIPENLNTVTN